MTPVIKTTALNFTYNGKPTVSELNLKVEAGSIYGFLGPNGAGKSTTIRLLLNLLPAKTGGIEIFGKQLRNNRSSILQRVGVMIESPAFYQHLSAIQNLKILARLRSVPEERIAKVLDEVNLSNVGNKKVRNFSMGMKQRLGIAAALLGNPDLLILDEPTNGLDPQGIKEIRDLLIRLNREQGKTIFISSHILPEVERVATQIGIIQNGKLVFQDSIEGLQKLQKGTLIRLRVTNPNSALPAIKQSNLVHHIGLPEENLLEIEFNPEVTMTDFTRWIKTSNIEFEEIYKVNTDLENLFLNLTTSKIR